MPRGLTQRKRSATSSHEPSRGIDLGGFVMLASATLAIVWPVRKAMDRGLGSVARVCRREKLTLALRIAAAGTAICRVFRS
jgi:hypothetical protein